MKYLFLSILLSLCFSCKDKSIQNGIVMKYYSNGKLKSEETYIDNKLEGISVFYSDQGLTSGCFMYQNGIRNGRYFIFYEDGTLNKTGHYSNGLLNGKYYEFDLNGDSLASKLYSYDKVIIDVSYKDGKRARIIDFKMKTMIVYDGKGGLKRINI